MASITNSSVENAATPAGIPAVTPTDNGITPRPMTLGRNIKIATFHFGSAFADILTQGVWNRIAIVELGMNTSLVALLLSLKYFFSIFSIWAGQRSDVTNFRGYRRLPFVWGGRGLMVLSFFMLGASTIALVDNRESALAFMAMVTSFVVFSIGSALSGTNFLSLIYDVTPEPQRTRTVSVVWFFLIAGFAVSGILYGRILPTYTREGFITLFIVAPLIMAAIWFFSLLGEERPDPNRAAAVAAARNTAASFWKDLKTAWAIPQTPIFFSFLGLSTMFFYTQDVILEPFGGLVFGMDVAHTSRFSSYWGTLTLVFIVLSLVAARRFPKWVNNMSLSQWSIAILAVAFGIFFVSAAAQIRLLVTVGLVVMGIGLGLWTVGTLGLMMDMTRAWRAGLYLALWTVSETLARGVGTLIGGIIKDVSYQLTGSYPMAFAAVFLVQTIGFVICLIILNRISIQAFIKQSTPEPEAVLVGSMD